MKLPSVACLRKVFGLCIVGMAIEVVLFALGVIPMRPAHGQHIPFRLINHSPATLQWETARHEALTKILFIQTTFKRIQATGQGDTSAQEAAKRAVADAKAAMQVMLEKEAPMLLERLQHCFRPIFSKSLSELTECFEKWYPAQPFAGGTFPAGYRGVWWDFFADKLCADYFLATDTAPMTLMTIGRLSEPAEPFGPLSLTETKQKAPQYLGVVAMRNYPNHLLMVAVRFDQGKEESMTLIEPVKDGEKLDPWKCPGWRTFFDFDAETGKTRYCPIQIKSSEIRP